MAKSEKELVDELKSQMPEFTGSKAEIQKRIAMFIYLKIGKQKAFDEKFYLADRETKDKIVKLERMIKPSKKKIIREPKITCLRISKLYKMVLKDFKIKSKVVRLHPQSHHYYSIVELSDGTKFAADLQKDLYNIHTGCKTECFGLGVRDDKMVDEGGMTEDEIFKLHKECGYVKSKEDYTDVRIKTLAEKLKGLPPDKTLEGILNDKSVNSLDSEVGYIEFYKYMQKLLKEITPNYFNRDIQYFNCYRYYENSKGKPERRYIMCIYAQNNGKLDIYLQHQGKNKFENVDLETLEKFERQGLILGKSQDERGLKIIRQHMGKMIVDRYKNKNNEDMNK